MRIGLWLALLVVVVAIAGCATPCAQALPQDSLSAAMPASVTDGVTTG